MASFFLLRWWAVALIGLLSHAVPAAADSLTVTGTGGALSIARLLAQGCMKANPQPRIEVWPVIGSTGGIKAVLAGRLDVGVASRPLTAAERERGAVEIPFALSPFAFCGHRDTVAAGITLREAIDIYDGRKTSWPDGTPIRLVLRPEGDSDLDVLRGISKEFADAVGRALRRPGMVVANTDKDAADIIENSPGSFGALAQGMVIAENRKVKVFPLDGLMPGAKALSDGLYPHEKRYAFVTVRSPSPAARRFLEYARSREAAAIISRAGYIPIR